MIIEKKKKGTERTVMYYYSTVTSKISNVFISTNVISVYMLC